MTTRGQVYTARSSALMPQPALAQATTDAHAMLARALIVAGVDLTDLLLDIETRAWVAPTINADGDVVEHTATVTLTVEPR